MNINEDFTCKHCKDTFVDPVFLNCCGENVCKKHIDKSSAFKCPFDCGSNIEIKNIQINKVLKNLMEREIHKFKIDPKYEAIIKNLSHKIKQIEILHSDPELFIYNNFNELKRLVDLDRENAKVEIDKIADEIIQKLDSNEKELKSECKSTGDFEYYGKLIANLKADLTDHEKFFKSLIITDHERENKSEEIEQTIIVLESEIKEYENKLMKNKTIEYDPMQTKISTIFGKLIVSEI